MILLAWHSVFIGVVMLLVILGLLASLAWQAIGRPSPISNLHDDTDDLPWQRGAEDKMELRRVDTLPDGSWNAVERNCRYGKAKLIAAACPDNRRIVFKHDYYSQDDFNAGRIEEAEVLGDLWAEVDMSEPYPGWEAALATGLER